MHDLALDLTCALDPIAFARAAGVEPEPWQADVLVSPSRYILLNCARGAGKSTVASLVGLHTAIYRGPCLVLFMSASQDQSSELFRNTMAYYRNINPEGLVQDSAQRATLPNGSRLISLPASEKSARGYHGVACTIVDEAARVPDEMVAAIRPSSITVEDARFLALSTPHGRRGWWWEAWISEDPRWKRVRVTGDQITRFPPGRLEEERNDLGEWKYRQEFGCEFVDSETQFFSSQTIEKAFNPDVMPLWSAAA